MNPASYRGRFAPSPTGPLHFGSVVAAVGSYLDAKANNGAWLLRIEDIDPPREQAGAIDTILRALEALALQWDGEVVYQSQRSEVYDAALEKLNQRNLLYGCRCSRKTISKHTESLGGSRYPGTCRGTAGNTDDSSLRVITHIDPISFSDGIQGHRQHRLLSESGDFIVRRRDQYYAYHLAVVVDDAEQGITHIVRGSDLLDCTPPQIHLQQILNLPTPRYYHLPVATNEYGQKLSKQNLARPVAPENASTILYQAMRFLGLGPDPELSKTRPGECLAWAIEHWDISEVPRTMSFTAPGLP